MQAVIGPPARQRRRRGRPQKYYGPGNAAGIALYKQNMKNLNARIRHVVRKQGETKWVTDRIAVASTAAGAFTQLAQLAQGDANGERDALETNHKSLGFNYTLSNTGNSQAIARLIIFKWKDNYNQAPTTGQILQNDTGGANPDVSSVYNLIYKDKYKILHDKLFQFGRDYAAGSVLASDNVVHKVRKVLKLQGKCLWVDDIATHYEEGSIHVLYIASNTNVQLVFNSLYKYTD